MILGEGYMIRLFHIHSKRLILLKREIEMALFEVVWKVWTDFGLTQAPHVIVGSASVEWLPEDREVATPPLIRELREDIRETVQHR
jgi:hypothetical protein